MSSLNLNYYKYLKLYMNIIIINRQLNNKTKHFHKQLKTSRKK